MSKAYLAWPIKLLGDEGYDHHLTLKYIGDSPFSVGDLVKRFAGQCTVLTPYGFKWIPEKFGAGVYVLRIVDGIRGHIKHCRKLVEDLRVDDYDEWRPHITVGKQTWVQIATQIGTPGVNIVDIGPLTLFVDKKPVLQFDP